jgi:threonine/homoserine/homoserine lactone efflux protein
VTAVDPGSVAPLVVTAAALMGTPGPSTVSLLASAVGYGVRPSVRYCVGLVVGTAAVLVPVATGLTAALVAVPGLRWALTAVAAGYLLRLAWHIATAPPLPDPDAAPGRHPALRDGLVLGVLNPKAWITLAAVFGSARIASAPIVDAGAKAVVLLVMIVAVHATWLLAGRLLLPVLRGGRRARVANVTMAATLVAATAVGLVA